MDDIAIIGGGITGMALACRLSRQGRRVTVFEKEEETGGLAGSIRFGDGRIDKYYRHVFPSHRELLDAIRELGLAERLVFRSAPMAYFCAGKTYPLDSAKDLLRFTPLSMLDRLRVGAGALTLLRRRDWRHLDGMTAAGLLKRACGERGYALFWEPLLKNKFGARAADVSATWLWDRLQSRSGKRAAKSSGALGYLRGGFRALFERMEAEVKRLGGRIATGHPITAIQPTTGLGGPFVLNHDPAARYRTCILTLPVPQFAGLVADLPRAYREQLAAIEYSHSVCMILRLRRRLSPYYWINVGDCRFPFAVVVEHTNWMDGEGAAGEHLVYLSRYVDSADDFAWRLPDHELLARYCVFLRRMFADFREADILGHHVCRDRFSQPVFTCGYAARKPPFATPLRDLYLVDTSQFYPRSRCMNTSFLLAREFLRCWPDGEGRG